MAIFRPFRDRLDLARYVLRWTLLATPVAALIGSACALFLDLLDRATLTRLDRPWLLYLLPLAGLLVVALYRLLGKASERGNNLILDEIHQPGAGVPLVMAPLILLGTVITHLFGGSAGREGAAVQIGGSLAAQAGRGLRLNPEDLRKLLMVGVAAGFGGVFGTPLAGAVFAMEFLVVGRLDYHALFPCLLAGLVGDWSCQAWNVQHTHYPAIAPLPPFDWTTAGKVALAAAAFGLVSAIFAELTHRLHALWHRLVRFELLRPVLGGLVVIAMVHLLGTRDYLGLGVTAPAGGVSIVSSFSPGGATAWSWWWKILFTAVTISCGFKGGEVTPLFFIGAALGNTLAGPLNAPVDLFAALGFVAVFAGATHTPLACTLMGVELFGSGHAGYLAIACFVAYLFSGHSGVYAAQRLMTPKPGAGPIAGPTPTTLGAHRQARLGRRVHADDQPPRAGA